MKTEKFALAISGLPCLIALFLMGSLAQAEEPKIWFGESQPVGTMPSDTTYYPLVVQTTKPDKSTWNSFFMKEGACLRGPLQFIDVDGKILLDLNGGAYFPVGCEASVRSDVPSICIDSSGNVLKKNATGACK